MTTLKNSDGEMLVEDIAVGLLKNLRRGKRCMMIADLFPETQKMALVKAIQADCQRICLGKPHLDPDA